ncbi:unnamed protein product [Prunus armeniaca]
MSPEISHATHHLQRHVAALQPDVDNFFFILSSSSQARRCSNSTCSIIGTFEGSSKLWTHSEWTFVL